VVTVTLYYTLECVMSLSVVVGQTSSLLAPICKTCPRDQARTTLSGCSCRPPCVSRSSYVIVRATDLRCI
jgi:hypothetical protein